MPLPSKPVLVFNEHFILVGMFKSIKDAAEVCNMTRQNIIQNLRGNSITANGKYWRNLPSDFIIDSDDIGKLTIFEFDKEADNPDRIVYHHEKVKAKRRKVKVRESCAPQPVNS